MLVTAEVKDQKALVTVDEEARINVEASGIELPPTEDFSFAIWFALPIAMRAGSNLLIDCPVDPAVVRNAEAVSRIWSMWQPHRFAPVQITAPAIAPTVTPVHGENFMFFSGGVDSAFAVLDRGIRAENVFAVTVRNPKKQAAFHAQLAKTEPLLQRFGYRRILLSTDAFGVMGDANSSHGFMLAACAFFLRSLFPGADLAADYTWAQEMLAVPWGTNHVTNRYLAGTDFSIRSVGAEAMRTAKLEALHQDGAALPTLSFCTSMPTDAQNCGRCSKCIRTKLAFAVLGLDVPDIFLDCRLQNSHLRKLDIREPNERAFLAELYLTARERGTLSQWPALGQLVAAMHRPPLSSIVMAPFQRAKRLATKRLKRISERAL